MQGAGEFAFVELSDGSCFTCLQVVVSKGTEGWDAVEKNSHIGCSFMFQVPLSQHMTLAAQHGHTQSQGDVVESQGKGQAIEIKATCATLFGACDPKLYPLSKGRLPLEHLRNFAHVRPRTNTIGAVARIRSCLATAVHEFFQQKVRLSCTRARTRTAAQSPAVLAHILCLAPRPLFSPAAASAVLCTCTRPS